MPTPDIIKLREEFLEKFPPMLEVQLHGFGLEVDEIFDWILSKHTQALSDREAEIVAGIEGMKRNVVVRFGDRIVKPLNLERDIQWDAALHDIATKITKGEI